MSKVQIGDYVVELPNPRGMWGVRMAGAEEYISLHNTRGDATAAVKRYQAADKRRSAKPIVSARTGKPVTREEVAARFA